MIEVDETYDLLTGIDQKAYGEFVKKEMGRKTPGIAEIRAYRNVLGSPQVRLTVVWQTLADWARWVEGAERQAFQSELLKFATNVKFEIWGPSPLIPEPIRRGK